MHFFFNDTATTEIYTLSLHDALPIYPGEQREWQGTQLAAESLGLTLRRLEVSTSDDFDKAFAVMARSEEHTSELQSRQYLVCRLLLEKKKKYIAVSSVNLTKPGRSAS